MKNNIKISVIIPFYDHCDWLIEAVRSVVNQTYSNLEIIVVNDGSKENIDSFLFEYGDKIKYVFQSNAGPGAARNKGIDLASGEYICFLDSDDIWLPNKLSDQLDFMLANNYVWCHTGGKYFLSDNYESQRDFNFIHNSGWVAKRSLVSMQIATPSVMIKLSVLKENPSLRFTAMRYSQDTLFYQMMAQMYELGYLNKNCVLIRQRSISRNVKSKNASKRYRIRFSSRRQCWYYINSSDNLFIPKPKGFVKLLFKQYIFADVFLCFWESKSKQHFLVENIAKFIFLYLFLFGRIYIYINDYIYNMEDYKSRAIS